MLPLFIITLKDCISTSENLSVVRPSIFPVDVSRVKLSKGSVLRGCKYVIVGVVGFGLNSLGGEVEMLSSALSLTASPVRLLMIRSRRRVPKVSSNYSPLSFLCFFTSLIKFFGHCFPSLVNKTSGFWLDGAWLKFATY